MDGPGGYLFALVICVLVALVTAWRFSCQAERMLASPDQIDEPVAAILVQLYVATTLGFVFITSPLGVPGGEFAETLFTKLGFELLVLAAVGWFALQTLRDQAAADVAAAERQAAIDKADVERAAGAGREAKDGPPPAAAPEPAVPPVATPLSVVETVVESRKSKRVTTS